MSVFKKGTIIPSAPSDPPPVNGSGNLYGCDIFHQDDVRSFSAMKAGGIEYLFVKASQGLTADPKCHSYFTEAKAAGLIVGAYHFYNIALPQVEQAQYFANMLNTIGLEKTDLPPVFDFEKADGNFGSHDALNAEAFLTELKRLTGRLPLVYMSKSTPDALGNPAWLKSYPWWIARYRIESMGPGIEPWVFWQFSESASIPGLGNPGDKNVFRGSRNDLINWISKT